MHSPGYPRRGKYIGFALIVIAVALVVTAGLLPVIFLLRHPGKKMDGKGRRRWLVAMYTLAAVSLLAVVLIVTVTKTITL